MKEITRYESRPLEAHRPAELLKGAVELTPEAVVRINGQVEAGEPLDSEFALDGLVEHFADSNPIDPYKVVRHMAASPQIGILLGADAGVKEKYLLHEHTQAVLGGAESDYIGECTDPTDRKVIRTASLLQDIAKPLWAAAGKPPTGQVEYNLPVASNILDTVDPKLLSAEEKTLVEILIAENVMGPAMKNVTLRKPDGSGIALSEAEARIANLQTLCPPSQRERLSRVLPIVYLADVTAYTNARSYRVPDQLQPVACQPVLNGLFAYDENGSLRFCRPKHAAVMDNLRTILTQYE